MKTAQQAREATKLAYYEAAKASLTAIKESVETAVAVATAKGMSRATVTLSADIDNELLQGVKRAYTKAGYRVKVETAYGTIAYNLIKPPAVTITLTW